MQDLESLIKQRLAKPVKNSSGATLLNDEGQINGSYSIADLKRATQNVSRDIKVKYYRELKTAKLI